MSYNLTRSALEATELTKKYSKKFREKSITDEAVSQYLERPTLKCKLKDTMTSTKHLDQFLTAFEELQLSSPLDDKENQNKEDEEHFDSVDTLPDDKPSVPQSMSLMKESKLFKNTGVEIPKTEFRNIQNQVPGPQNDTGSSSFLVDNSDAGLEKDNGDSQGLNIKQLSINSQNVPSNNCNPKSTKQPVQIIEMTSNENRDVTGANRFIFKRKNLQQILAKVGDKPVALVTIAGPSRYGKSFILSYVLKYFQSCMSPTNNANNSNWMSGTGTKDATEALPPGFSWKSGLERETTGIWMWPEPFPLKMEDGTELNVILVDTQGVFDSHTDRKDWATIVGLSLLTSSCLILNVMNTLQEDTLNALKEFMDFGLMANSPSDPTQKQSKPFQKLYFLIRDWGFTGSHPYGVQGGAGYIQWVLQQKNLESGRQIRNQMQECFEEIQCFLMPSPGDAVKQPQYNGSVADMDPQFANHIQIFIEHLFHTSPLSSKRICNETLTADKLFLYFDQYVNVFNSNQMPSPDDLNQANITVSNQIVSQKCLEDYKQILREYLSKTSFVPTEHLEAMHKRTASSVTLNFEKARKMGGADVGFKFKCVLQLSIEEVYRELFEANLRNRDNCVKAEICKMQAYYADIMEEHKMKLCNAKDDFVLVNIFENISKVCLKQTKQKLAQTLHLDSCELLTRDETKYFMDCLESWKGTLELVNKFKQCIAEQKLQAVVFKHTLEFKSQFKQHVLKTDYWTLADLAAMRTNTKSAVLNSYNSAYSSSLLHEQGNNLLRDSMEAEVQATTELVHERNINFLTGCHTTVAHATYIYKEKMEISILTIANINMADTHCELSKCSTDFLRNFKDFNKLPRDVALQFETELEDKLQKSYTFLIEKWFPRKQQTLSKNYKERLLDFCEHFESIRVLDEEALQRKHEEEKGNVMEELKLFINHVPLAPGSTLAQNSSLILSDFESELNSLMKHILETNQLRITALKPTVDGYYSYAKLQFLDLKNHINQSFLEHRTYYVEIQNAIDNVLEEFKSQCSRTLGAVPLEAHILELQRFMGNITEIQRIGAHILEIRSRNNLHFSTERKFFEKCGNVPEIREVRWISPNLIVVDDSLCGQFWQGKNVVLYTNQIQVIGRYRCIDVSGGAGLTPQNVKPSTPAEPGQAGENGSDGCPGEHGGDITIIARHIDYPRSLHLISDGGLGGNGREGGNGSAGATNGLNGNQIRPMSLEKMTHLFPSPVSSEDSDVLTSLDKCQKSLQTLASTSSPVEVKHNTEVAGVHSKYWELQNTDGSQVQCGFYSQGSKCFYVWYKGALGTNGQPGGLGGFGGRGGNPGNPGKIQVSIQHENDVIMTGFLGEHGASGKGGVEGVSGVDGVQGEDYVIMDPYSGVSGSPRLFAGNLEVVVLNGNSVSRTITRLLNLMTFWRKSLVEAAYCPYRQEYISFIDSTQKRRNVDIHGGPKQPKAREALPFSVKYKVTEVEDIIRHYGQPFYSDPNIYKTGSTGYDYSPKLKSHLDGNVYTNGGHPCSIS